MAKNEEYENTSINLIGQDTEIIGEINSSGDIRIDGSLKGTLNTKGKVVIGASGKVEGEIHCKNSEVSGLINGKIFVSQVLNLKSSSKILGDIETCKLAIEPGAIFTGTCKMTNLDKADGGSKPKEE